MGFWSAVGQVAKAGFDQAKELNQEIKSNIDMLDQRDDDYVREKLKSGTASEKMAAARVLKSRGYTKDSL